MRDPAHFEGISSTRPPRGLPKRVADDDHLPPEALALLAFRVGHNLGNYALNQHYMRKHFGLSAERFAKYVRLLANTGYLQRHQPRPRPGGPYHYAQEAICFDPMPAEGRNGWDVWGKSDFDQLKGIDVALVGIYVFCCSLGRDTQIDARRIARRFAMSPKTARRKLAALAAAGLLVETSGRGPNGRFLKNLYLIKRLAPLEQGWQRDKAQTIPADEAATDDAAILEHFDERTRNLDRPTYQGLLDCLPSKTNPDDCEEALLTLPDSQVWSDCLRACGNRISISTPAGKQELCNVVRSWSIAISRYAEIEMASAYEFILGIITNRIGTRAGESLSSAELLRKTIPHRVFHFRRLGAAWPELMASPSASSLSSEMKSLNGKLEFFGLLGRDPSFGSKLQDAVDGNHKLESWSDAWRLVRTEVDYFQERSERSVSFGVHQSNYSAMAHIPGSDTDH